MAKTILSLFIVLSLLTIQSHSLSVVNNVTVPSDILNDLFFNEIRNIDAESFAISTKDTNGYNTLKCIFGLQQIIAELPALRVLPFIDAWGSLPSGLLQFHLVDIGNFDQCLRTSVNLSLATGFVNGQYCFATIPLISQQSLKSPLIKNDFLIEPKDGLVDLLKISIGICVPDTCSPQVLTSVFRRATNTIFNGALSGVSVDSCQVAKKPDYVAADIAGIVIFSIFGALMVLSSAYDFFMEYFDKTPNPTLLAFSIFTNGKKLFAINTKKSPNSIDCLTGIRVFSMAWVLYCHNYSVTAIIPLVNTIDILTWFRKAWSMHVINATVSVDSFLFISGLLVAWLGFRELDKTKGKLSIVMMYVHRYIRLTPPVAGMILFLVSVDKFLGSGTFRNTFLIINSGCKEHWWVTLLYVQNYVSPEAMCVSQTWYLAVDFQLYILSPLLLIPMWKWGWKFTPVLVVLALLSIGCVIATFFAEGFTDLMGIREDNIMQLTYFPTHTRYSPWIVGLGLGYIMYVNRQKTLRPPKILQLLGWIVCFTTILAIIFGPYFTMTSDRNSTVLEAAMYESLKRVSWSIALAWIVFACHFGFGGLVNSFLSHPFWQPLGRLTYSLYLVHIAVIGINFGSIRTDMYFSDFTEILIFWSTFGISILAAIMLTLAFEAPVLVLEKAIFNRESSTNNGKASVTATSNNTVEVPFNKNV